MLDGGSVTGRGERQTTPMNDPIARSWPAVNRWDSRLEEEYAEFVARLGQAVAARKCRRLDQCLRNPEWNLLFDPENDPNLTLDVDCGDLPYVLRGYFSYKRRLPFGFVCEVDGTGNDIRYMKETRPTRWCGWQRYRSPRALLHDMSNQVHSGMYRMAPEIESADFYPLAVTRQAIRPGATYYDPNGHVLTVAEVRADGSVYLIDGHPDGSLTWKRFGQAFALGGRGQGGGFKGFRTLSLANGELVRASNQTLPFFDDRSQWDHKLWTDAGPPGTYHNWVRRSLAAPEVAPDPVAEFRDEVRALCRDLGERVEAVAEAVTAGLPQRSHPAELPWNIYGTNGDWEVYATPSRDARLKAAFRELHETAQLLPATSPLIPALRQAWLEETRRPECRLTYTGSTGKQVALGMDEIVDRLFLLSFDPYNCVELRWGAPAGSAELAACTDDATKLDFYAKERRLRNRIDRDYGSPTPLSDGPEAPPDIDARPHLGLKRE